MIVRRPDGRRPTAAVEYGASRPAEEAATQGGHAGRDGTPSQAMSSRPDRIYFDFVDPLSYVASRTLAPGSGEPRGDMPEWVGFELRPPPTDLTTSDDPMWLERTAAARPGADELGLTLNPPRLVPWTRKAHELHLLAAARGHGHEIRDAVFDAFFRDGRDIGRVDVLVEIAASVGLDRTETKAVLDVDRHEAEVAEARRVAEAAGVTDVPCYSMSGRLVRGFPDPTGLGTLLPDE